MAIAILLAVGVIIGLIDLIKYFSLLLYADPADSYQIFQSFLAYALLLIVGVELILMVLYHSTKSILELVLFVIARKMLIYSNNMIDLVLGTLAIAIVFATLKFLVLNGKKDIIKREGLICSAETIIKDINQIGYNIQTNKGETLGNLVSNLASERHQELKEGIEFKSGKTKIKITKLKDTGKIEEVMLINNKEETTGRNTFGHGKNLFSKNE